MDLSSHRSARFAFLAVMYLAQGLPWGFVSVALTGYMYEQGLSTKDVGAMLAMAMSPWPFKWMLGPIIDRWTILGMGRRRPWILTAQFCMVLSTLTILCVPDITSALGLLGMVLLFHNCFVALQDVSVDALAVDILEEGEREKANSVMYSASLTGTFIGSAGLGYIIGVYGLHAGLWILATLQICIFCLPLLIRERSGEKLLPWTRGQAAGTVLGNNNSNLKQLALRIVRAFSLRATLLGVVLALTAGIGLMMVSTIIQRYIIQDVRPLLFTTWSTPEIRGALDQGSLPEEFRSRFASAGHFKLGRIEVFPAKEMISSGSATPIRNHTGRWSIVIDKTRFDVVDRGKKLCIHRVWTQADYSLVSGTTLITAVIGSLLAGYLGSFYGVRSIAGCATVALGITWIFFAFILGPQIKESTLAVYMHVEQLIVGIYMVSLWAMFMQISWTLVAATQFTAYMALLNVSRIIGSKLAGEAEGYLSLADWSLAATKFFGIETVPFLLLLAGIMQITVVIGIMVIDPDQTRRILGVLEKGSKITN
jgi:MFS family permease